MQSRRLGELSILTALIALLGAKGSHALTGAVDESSGEATVALPILTPVGTAGTGPDLELRYRSGSGRGRASWTGFGWTLAGLSQIERDTRHGVPYDYARPKQPSECEPQSAPCYPYQGRFVLDGRDLVCATSPCDGTYRTQQDDGRLIRFFGQGAGWEIQDRDGVVFRYGTSASARVVNPSNREVFAWHLESVRDVHGNWIQYTYDQATSPGVAYVETIGYAQAGEPEANRRVDFLLAPRPDAAISYRGGFREHTDHSLTRIDVRAAQGALVTRYELGYEHSPDSGRALLTSVQRFGSDGTTALPPHRFSYSEGGWAFSAEPSNYCTHGGACSTNTHTATGWPSRGFVDLDRDGLTDVLLADTGVAARILRGLGDGLAAAEDWSANPVALLDGISTSSTFQADLTLRRMLIDINGDRYPDSVSANGTLDRGTPTGLDDANPLELAMPPLPFFPDAGEIPPSWLRFQKRYTDGSLLLHAVMSDMNGDGLADLVASTSDPTALFWGYAGTPNAADWRVHLNLGPSDEEGDVEFGLTPLSWPDPYQRTFEDSHDNGFSSFGRVLTIDVNADALPDRVNMQTFADGRGRSVWVAYNHGAGFAAPEVVASWTYPNDSPIHWASAGADLRGTSAGCVYSDVLDLNGDGFPDLVQSLKTTEVQQFGDPARPAWLVRFGTGHGFRNRAEPWSTSIQLSSLPAPGALYSYECVSTRGPNPGEVVSGLADLNGDGLVDHHGPGDDEIYLAQGPQPDLLIEATDPFGGSSVFGWGSSARMRDDANAPANPGLGPRPVVTRLRQRDGRAQTSDIVNSYHYSKGVYDFAEDEFRGFGAVERTEHSEHPDGHMEILTAYATDKACGGRVTARTHSQGSRRFDDWIWSYERLYGPAGVPEEQTWTACLPRETIERSLQTGTDPGRARGSLRDYGSDPVATHYNLLALREYGELDASGENLSSADDRFTYYFYATPTGPSSHIVSRLSEVIVTDTPASDPHNAFALSHTRLYYDESAGVSHGQIDIGRLERTEVLHRNPWVEPPIDEWVSRHTVFDGYGNAVVQRGPPTSSNANGFVIGIEYDSTYRAFRRRVLHGAGLGLGALVTKWSYDDCAAALDGPPALGLPCTVVDPRGTEDRFGYDALGRTTRVERSSGLVELRSYALPAEGEAAETRTEIRLIASGASPLVVERWSDGLGRLFEEHSPGKSGETIVVSRSFDERGRLAAETVPHFEGNPAPRVRVIEYDALGRRAEETASDGTTRRVWTYTPWAVGEDVYFGSERQSRTERRLDGRGRLIEVAQYENSATLSDRRIVTARYDALDRLVRVDDPVANDPNLCARYPSGSPCAQQLHSTLLFYDTLGRRVRIEDPDSGVWSFEFDRAGLLTRQTNGAARVQTFEYDGLGRLSWRRFGVQGNGTYNAQFVYGGTPGTPEFGRLIAVETPHVLGTDYAYSYDPAGRKIWERQVTERRSFENAYTYDELDRVVTRTFPDGEIVRYRYDGVRLVGIEGEDFVSDAVTEFADEFDILMDAHYDALGRTERLDLGDTFVLPGYGPAVVLERDYDPVTGHLARVAATGRGSPSALPDMEVHLAFDGLGRLLHQSGHTGVVELGDRSFAYDGLGRLVEAVGPWEKPQGNSAAVAWSYRYDPLGGLLEQTSGNTDLSTRYERSWRYEDPEKPRFLTSFSERAQQTQTEAITADAAGVPLRIGIKTVLWNHQNRLHRLGAVAYDYDAFDRRVRDRVGQQMPIVYVGADFEYDTVLLKATKYFLVNGERVATRATFYQAMPPGALPGLLRWLLLPLNAGALPFAEAVALLGILGLARTAFARRPAAWPAVPGVGLVISALVLLPASEASAVIGPGDGPSGRGGHSEGILIYGADHLGSTRVVMDAWGDVVETRDYAPFGHAISWKGPFALKHRFTGQPHEDISGLTYYGARIYNARWARFLSPDEKVESFDVQGLHPYAYVRNQPTSLIDPDGRSSLPSLAYRLGVGSGGVAVAAGLFSEIGDQLGPDSAAGTMAKAVGGGLAITGATLGAGLAIAVAVGFISTAPVWATLGILVTITLLGLSLYSTIGDLRDFGSRSLTVETESSMFVPPVSPSGSPVVSAQFDGVQIRFEYADGTFRTESVGGGDSDSSGGGRSGDLWGEPPGTQGPKTQRQTQTEAATAQRAGPGYGNVAQGLAFSNWFDAGGGNWTGF